MKKSKRAVEYLTLSALAVGALLLLSSCARYPANLVNLYGELKEEGALRKSTVLEGRRIVIDPGHGGYFDGVVGADSLREADANLGVALYLWGLLKDAGADVHLTRTTDRDFLPQGSTALGEDLKNRIELANSYEPEVFISIHHNSVLPLDRRKNRIELYYKSSDTAASLVLANDIAMHLARNLGIANLDVKPGDYFVLRNSSAPLSVLGEASYLSNPWVEKKLKLSEKQKLEAQAYFLGLIDYFARGVPRIKRISPAEDTTASAPLLEFAVEEANGIPADPKTAKVVVGRKIRAASYLAGEKKMLLKLPRRLPNGTYRVQASIMSIRQGCAKSKPFRLTIARPPSAIVKLRTQAVPPHGVRLGFKVLDEIGLPVLDGTKATLISPSNKAKIASSCKDGFVYFNLREAADQTHFVIKVGELQDTFSVYIPPAAGGISLIVKDSVTSMAIQHPIVTIINDTTYTGDIDGRVIARLPSNSNAIISAKGYNPRIVRSEEIASKGKQPFEVYLKPIFAGVLKNKRISIDPGGLEGASSNAGPSFLRESFVNLAVAKALRDLLLLGGAKVALTRSGEEPISTQERISKVNLFHSDIALRINHSRNAAESDRSEFQILHYPNSKKGAELSRSLASAMNELYSDSGFSINESARPFLLQTHCPAIEIFSAPVEEEFYEKLLLCPKFLRTEAEKLLEGIVNFFVGNSISPLSSCEVSVARGEKPLAGVSVTINQSFSDITNTDGKAKFNIIDSGPATICIETPDGTAKIFTAEIKSGDANRISIKLE